MAAKMPKLEMLEEGEYELPYGKVVVSRSGGGYKIVIYIDEKTVGRAAAEQILKSFLSAANDAGLPV